MSQALTLARPYARAAFAVAREAGALPGWSAALGFAARVAAEPQAAVLLDNPKLTRADVVALLAPDGAQDAFRNLLGLLFDNRRLPLLPEIAGLFDELRFEAERVVAREGHLRGDAGRWRAGNDQGSPAQALRPRGRGRDGDRRKPDRRCADRCRRRRDRRLDPGQAGAPAVGAVELIHLHTRAATPAPRKPRWPPPRSTRPKSAN